VQYQGQRHEENLSTLSKQTSTLTKNKEDTHKRFAYIYFHCSSSVHNIECAATMSNALLLVTKSVEPRICQRKKK
jgi:hypothetical protein